MLTDLADACRTSGLRVVERPGWRSRGKGQMVVVRTIVAHHDVTPADRVNGALEYVEANELSHIVLARDGTVFVVAAGLCWHAGRIGNLRHSNPYAIGIEAAHTGNPDDAYPPVQYDAYVALAAALARHYGLDAADVQGHKEIARPVGRKTDPTFDMSAFRASVAAILAPTPEEVMPTVAEITAAVWGGTFGAGTRRRTAGQLLVEAHAASLSAQRLAARAEAKVDALSLAVAGLDGVDEEALAAAIAERVERADAQAVAARLTLSVTEEA